MKVKSLPWIGQNFHVGEVVQWWDERTGIVMKSGVRTFEVDFRDTGHLVRFPQDTECVKVVGFITSWEPRGAEKMQLVRVKEDGSWENYGEIIPVDLERLSMNPAPYKLAQFVEP